MGTIATSPGWRTLRRGVRSIREETSTTPGRLRLLSVVIAGGAAVLWIVGSTLLLGSRTALDRIGQGAVPAIVTTQQIHSALSDADRAAANAFLSGGVEIVEPRTQYEIDLATATQELEQVAEQNRAGPAATEQIQAIDALLVQYAGLVETARANNRQGFPVGVAYLRDASSLMHRPRDGILARVDLLGTLNARDLAGQESGLTLSLASTGVFVALAAVLCWVLVHTQVLVAHRFRRRVNDHLLVATVLLTVLTAWMGGQAAHTAVEASTAQAAYSRLHDLWLARSLANDADGNVSLSLIALGEGDEFDQAFAAETHQLVDRPLTDQVFRAALRGHVRFGGLLADEVRMASLPGEREAATRALRTYQQFLLADADVRKAVAAGTPDSAVAIALGTSPGQLAVTFGELDEALGDAIVIEQQQFAAAADAAGSGLGLEVGLPALALGIALLTFWGLEPRIAEYRA